MDRLKLQIVAKRYVADDIVSLELKAPDRGTLPQFTAGAHVNLFLRDGLVRQYSLCNSPREQDRYVLAVLRERASRGGSSFIHDTLREGDMLEIGAPRNYFPLKSAEKTLLFAGGVGITPLLAMAEELALRYADFRLHYFARSPSAAAYRQRIQESSFAGNAHLHFGAAAAENEATIQDLLAQPRQDCQIYVCGPSGFIACVTGAASIAGWAPSQVAVEHFGQSGLPTATKRVGEQFQVRIRSTGQLIEITDSETVVDALSRHGIDIPVSCGRGACGTCAVAVLDGVPEHRDNFFSKAEKARNNQFTPCCSRSLSQVLTLDL